MLSTPRDFSILLDRSVGRHFDKSECRAHEARVCRRVRLLRRNFPLYRGIVHVDIQMNGML